MYHAIVRAKVRRMWQRVTDTGDFAVAVRMAVPEVEFHFVAPPPLGVRLRGREQFAAWFEHMAEVLPGLRFALTDVVVGGPPWNTKVAVRLDISARLADGSEYRNEAMQWVRIRWGRMVSDYVLEDTVRLVDAVRRQQAAVKTG